MILQQKIVLTELNNEHWWFNQEKMNLAIENIFFLAVANAMIIGYKKGMYKQRQFAPGDCVGCQDPT